MKLLRFKQVDVAARQGMQLGRDGRIDLRVEGDDIYLGGNAVTCVEGSLRAE
ncbi:MAG: hypothetical protein ACREUO_12800 [Burkholderiales bacterium]